MEAAEHPQKIHHLAFDPGGGDAGQIREDIVAYIREHYTEELSMQDVARAMNYSDANYFARVFKRVTGMTPSEYRSN